MDEPVENVLLESLVVIFDILPLPNLEGIVAMREDNGGQLTLIVEEMAAVEMGDGNLVLTPEGQNTIPRKTRKI